MPGKGQKLRPIQIGERNGSLQVMERLHKAGINWMYRLRCDCGTEIVRSNSTLRHHKSCAACGHQLGAIKRRKHGASGRTGKGNLYSVWQGMKGRCENPNHSAYRWYGAKGVTVCSEWRDFIGFQAWALREGWQRGLTLDRIDANKGYSPTNCRLTTQSQNSKNMRQKYQVVRRPFADGYVPIEALWGTA